MQKLNIPEKQEGDEFFADEANQIVTSINEVAEDAVAPTYALSGDHFVLDGTVVVDGRVLPLVKIAQAILDGLGMTRQQLLDLLEVIPKDNLPPFYITGGSGSGDTEDDPYALPSVIAWFKALPNWSDTEDRMVYFIAGQPVLGPVVTGGSPEPLDPSVLTIGTPGINGAPVSWTEVDNALTYALKVSLDDFATAITAYSGSGLAANITGLTPATTYKAKVEAIAPGWNTSESNVIEFTTANDGWNNLQLVNLVQVDGFTVVGDPTVVSLTGNNGAPRFATDIALPEGAAGKFRFTSTGGGLGLGTTPDIQNRDTLNYGATLNPGNNKVQAFQLAVGELDTPVLTPPVTTTIEVTNAGGTGGLGEVIMSYGSGTLTEWRRFNRTAGVFKIKAIGEFEGVLTAVQYQGGFE